MRLNNGQGTFSGDFAAPVHAAGQVALGDVDADGDLDVVVANLAYGERVAVSILLNNGKGVLNPTSVVAMSGQPNDVVLGDVDGDGDLDLAVAYSRQVSVRLNDGHGLFSAGPDLILGTSTSTASALTLGDLDSDGTLDLAVANIATKASVRLNPATASPCANDTQAPVIVAAGFAITLVNGQATIQPEDVDGGSSDNCGSVSLALDKSSFTCANIGLNPVTLIVTDQHGNVARQTVDILVRGDGTCTAPAFAAGDQLNVYPNPVVNRVRLRISDLTAGALVNVYNCQGTRVLTQALTSADQSVDFSTLPTGVYLLKVSNGSQVLTQRVVKN